MRKKETIQRLGIAVTAVALSIASCIWRDYYPVLYSCSMALFGIYFLADIICDSKKIFLWTVIRLIFVLRGLVYGAALMFVI